MARHLSNRAQFVGGFLASLALAYVIHRRDDDGKRIESEIYGSIGTTVGLFVGCKLAERADE